MARVMVVEDDLAVRETIASMLRHAGHVVVCVETGRGLLDRLKGQSFDLIVTDIVMAFEDGLDVIRTMSRERPGVPIIAVTGGSRILSPEAVERFCRGFGVAHVLLKPFRMSALVTAVNDAVGRPALSLAGASDPEILPSPRGR
jgi:CheY-like chemotaxis protein